MALYDLKKLLSENSYPGRGIVIGKSADGKSAMFAYFIMGRSVNSRNRIFERFDGGMRTKAFDESKLSDPSLIIYNPFLRLGIFLGNGSLAGSDDLLHRLVQKFIDQEEEDGQVSQGDQYVPYIDGNDF